MASPSSARALYSNSDPPQPHWFGLGRFSAARVRKCNPTPSSRLKSLHQQQDQYLFSHKLDIQSSEFRLERVGAFHFLGCQAEVSSPLRRRRNGHLCARNLSPFREPTRVHTASRAQQNPLKLLNNPSLKGRSKSDDACCKGLDMGWAA